MHHRRGATSARTSPAPAPPDARARSCSLLLSITTGGLRVDDEGVRRARKEDDRKSADDGARAGRTRRTWQTEISGF